MGTKGRSVRSASAQASLFESPAAPSAAPPAPVVPAVEAAPRRSAAPRREDAQSMAARQREISVSEFFTKNRHLLGFDNPQKALLTAVKEAVDNSLDACEEAGLLPDLEVEITQLAENRYRVAVQDNGPGIVGPQIPKIFGKLLYGSKFHRLKQQRGQQGIGISAAGMYGQLTTGRPVQIVSRPGKRKPAHLFQISIDTKRNAPVVLRDEEIEWEPAHGTRVELELEAIYKKGRRSIDDYVEQTVLANPHVRLRYLAPGEPPRLFERVSNELPKEAQEIKPHPYGLELGLLLRMMKDSPARNLRVMLTTEFSRVSPMVADQICTTAGVSAQSRPARLTPPQVELLFQAISKVKIMAPPTACLSPIGETLLQRGLEARVQGEFFTAVTRPPAVYRGNPFQVEVGVAYGGALPAEEPIELFRFANRVPLQYQQSACAVTKSVISVDWRNYGLQQSRGALPLGPLAVVVHVASVWVPFTSESKEAVASYPEILRELRLALMEAGRRLGAFVRKRRRLADEQKKRSYIEQYIPHIGDALQAILGLTSAKRDAAVEHLRTILERSRKL
ncbi:MAG TPA: DNA topoisomerase VI subunit B [Candidatus Polarisedimenticolaceae bacterium]|nr:DNA topoisomerase VI subunit B [Candidatus Polarisedimenticolaceae bacterium]